MKERHRTPRASRSTNCSSATSAGFPVGLVGPTFVVPVQIEGIYAKALLDSGSQVTILYRNFYDAYLKHLAIQPIENLEIWGLSSHKYPYDGYLPIRLEFTENVVGVPQKVDTLALVCPNPVKEEGIAILVGTNTRLVKKLFDSCQEKAGDEFLSSLTIHPMVREAYQTLKKTDILAKETEQHGTVWFTQRNPRALNPGQLLHVTGVVKVPGGTNGELVLIDQPEDISQSPELQIQPEVHPASVLHNKRITVTVKNISSKEIVLKRGTPLAHVFLVALVPQLRAETHHTFSCLEGRQGCQWMFVLVCQLTVDQLPPTPNMCQE